MHTVNRHEETRTKIRTQIPIHRIPTLGQVSHHQDILHNHQRLQAISVLVNTVLLRMHRLIWLVVVLNSCLNSYITEATNPPLLHHLQMSTQDLRRLVEAVVEEDLEQSTKRELVHHLDKVHQHQDELDHLERDEIVL